MPLAHAITSGSSDVVSVGPVTEGLSYKHLTCANGFVRRKQESRLVKINATLVKRVPCALSSRKNSWKTRMSNNTAE